MGAEPDRHGSGVVASLQHCDRDVQCHTDRVEVPQHRRIGVRDPGDAPALAVDEVAELSCRGSGHRAVDRGNRIAVRIAFGMAELGVHPGDHQIRDGVFEYLRLVVHLVPAVPQFVHQIRLDEAVPADHSDGGDAPRLGEGDRPVPGVIDETLVGQFPDGLRHGGRRHPDLLGEQFRGHPLLRPLLNGPDDLEVVLRHCRESPGLGGRILGHALVILVHGHANELRQVLPARHIDTPDPPPGDGPGDREPRGRGASPARGAAGHPVRR